MSKATDRFEETAFTFRCGQNELVAIHHPGATYTRIGILFVVGGRQYRAGAHRQFTLIARHLNQHGLPVLRFDVRGMGDSTGEQRHFLDLDQDIRQAVRELKSRSPHIDRVLLWGLCDGASASILSAATLPIVSGVLMVNPWITTDHSAARVQLKHYYRQRLFSGSFWNKLINGEVKLSDSIKSLFSTLSKTRSDVSGNTQTTLPDIVFASLAQFRGAVHILISDKDNTAREFEDEFVRRSDLRDTDFTKVQMSRLNADHTFSTAEQHEQLCALSLKFAKLLDK